MVHEFKAGDWAVGDDGERLFVVGVDSDGGVVCQPGSGMRCYDHEAEDLTPLPDCMGWDWVPAAQAASDDSTEFVPFNSQADPVYVIASVERDAWDGVGFGKDIETSDECLLLTHCGSVPGGSLFLLADELFPITQPLCRLLSHGETVQADDQFWRDEFGWVDVSHVVVGFNVFAGCVPLRRKITR